MQYKKGIITLDEAEAQIDYFIMLFDCPKKRGEQSGILRKVG